MNETSLPRVVRAYNVLRHAWALSRQERILSAWRILTERRTTDLLAECRAEVVRRLDAMESPNRERLIVSAEQFDALPYNVLGAVRS